MPVDVASLPCDLSQKIANMYRTGLNFRRMAAKIKTNFDKREGVTTWGRDFVPGEKVTPQMFYLYGLAVVVHTTELRKLLTQTP